MAERTQNKGGDRDLAAEPEHGKSKEQRRVTLISLQGDPNIGLFIAANNKHAFSGITLNEQQKKAVKDILGCDVIQLTIAGIPYPGIFLLFDKNRILVPSIIFDSERKRLENLGYEVVILNTIHTALRNSIVIHDKKALISKETEKETEGELKALGYSVLRMHVDEFESIGNLLVIDADYGFASLAFTDEDKAALEKHFGAKITLGTANNRNLYISSSIVINSNGILIGSESMPDEVMDITGAFEE